MNWKCRQCQANLEIPDGATMKFCPQCGAKVEMSSVPADSSQKSAQTESSICPVCCAPIQPGDDCIVCPDCKMAYHQDCWNDNNGCATYGCSSAGCLKPTPKIEESGTVGGVARKTVCPYCGISLTAGVTFCWSCGRDLTSKEKTEKQEDGKWDLFHPEKLWRTNKWWAVATFCLFLIFFLSRRGGFSSGDIRVRTSLFTCFALVAVVTGIIGYIKHAGWKHFIKKLLAVVAILNAIIIVSLIMMEQMIWTVIAIIIEIAVIVTGIKYVIEYIKRVGWNVFIAQIGGVVVVPNTIFIVILIGMEQVIWAIIAIIIEIVAMIFIIKVEMNMNSNASEQSAAGSSGVICPKCHTQLAAGTTFCRSCGNKLDAMTKLAVDVPLAGAWSRWGARMLDCTLEAIALFFVIRMILTLANVNEVVTGIIFAPSIFLLDSAVYAIFKNTLGKWLFGVKIIELSGMPVNAKRYFFRNLLVYLIGFGLAFPIVLLFTFADQCNSVSNGKPATYDKILDLKSVRGNANTLKTFFGFVLLIILYIGLALALIVAAK